MKLCLFTFTISLFLIVGTNRLPAQEKSLLEILKGTNSSSTQKKPASSGSNKNWFSNSNSKKKTNGTWSNSSNSSSSGGITDLMTALTGKTAEERAKQEAARKKAAAAKAQEDAWKKQQAESERKKAAAKREWEKAQLAKKKAQEKAAKEWELAEKKRVEAAKKQALAAQKAKEEQAKKYAAEQRAKELERQKAKEEQIRLQRQVDAELIARAKGKPLKKTGGFLFGKPAKRASAWLDTAPETEVVASPPGRYLYINEKEVNNLNSSNSYIIIDLSEQRAKVYYGSTLVIETQISSGGPGHATSPGNFFIGEKLIDKKSGRYGTWYDAAGNKLKGDDAHAPPAGGVKFVGVDMPYWLRINGGIGMHIGYVPNNPVSHGCIRVPSTVQPLIYSKVKVGTSVTIVH